MTNAMRPLVFGLIGMTLAAAPAAAESQKGAYTYFSAQTCASAGKVSKEACSYAAANAAAEFEEKAPHFPTRTACEQAYRQGSCALSLRQSALGAGAKGGVSFTPRQQGFRITVRSDFDISTVPLAPGLQFSNRTAIRQAISIDPRVAGSAAPRVGPVGASGGAGGGAVFGSPTAVGDKAPLPPPVPVDPNFDCAKYVEPSSKGDVQSACAPAPNWRR